MTPNERYGLTKAWIVFLYLLLCAATLFLALPVAVHIGAFWPVGCGLVAIGLVLAFNAVYDS